MLGLKKYMVRWKCPDIISINFELYFGLCLISCEVFLSVFSAFDLKAFCWRRLILFGHSYFDPTVAAASTNPRSWSIFSCFYFLLSDLHLFPSCLAKNFKSRFATHTSSLQEKKTEGKTTLSSYFLQIMIGVHVCTAMKL